MKKHLNSKFAIDLPYPPISVCEENKTYAIILHSCYAGSISELSSEYKLNYQELILCKDYPVIADALNGISIVDKYHLKLLGELIILLGGDPRYWIYKKGKPSYWSPSFINHITTTKEILLHDIKDKNNLINQYETIINNIDDENIVAIIKRIIQDEQYHISILNELYSKYIK